MGKLEHQNRKQASSARRLAAILFADIVGYTSLMQADETLALQKIKRYQALLGSAAQQFNGQIIKNYGDGSLMTFSNSLDAVKAAKQIQEEAKTELTVPLRIGIHVGEFIVEKGDIYGNGVNLASRIESLGITGAVLFSKNIFEKIKNQPEFEVQSLGAFDFKNVGEPMEVFALANDGFPVPKREEMQGKVKPLHQGIKWQIPILIITLLAFVSAIWFFNKTSSSTTKKETPSIAILQFEDGSSDKSLAYLGFGLKEELLTALIKLQKLDIVSRGLIETAQSNSTDPQVIGDALQADYILGGSVQANENTIRFNVRLLDVVNKNFVWAHNQESPRSEMLRLQQEFAVAIMDNLPIQVTEGDLNNIKNIDVDPKAYELYLKGAYWANFVVDTIQKSSVYLLKAIAIDPSFSAAYAKLGSNEHIIASHGIEPPIPHWIKAQKYIEKALDLDSLNGEALGDKGVIQHNYEWDYEGAEKTFKKAIQLDQNQAQHYAWFLGCNGRNEELLDYVKYFKNNTEFAPFIAMVYTIGGDLNSAQQVFNDFQANLDKDWFLNWAYGYYFLAQKKYTKAIPYLEKAIKLEKNNLDALAHLGFAYGKTDKTEKANEILSILIELKESRYVPTYHFAVINIGIGNLDTAFNELNRTYDEHDWRMRWIWNDPVFYESAIQIDPRYRDLLNKMKLGHLPPRKTLELKD